MVLIIGGSYQGKLDFARQRYGLSPEDIQLCDDRTEAIEPGKRCIAGLERFALNRVRSDCDPMEAFAGMERFRDSILICAPAAWCRWTRCCGPGARPAAACAPPWPGTRTRSGGCSAGFPRG